MFPREVRGLELHPTDIQKDPLFVAPEKGDFHLQSRSPCIDAGTSLGMPGKDPDGKPRRDMREIPDRGAGKYSYYDIGAFEYVDRK